MRSQWKFKKVSQLPRFFQQEFWNIQIMTSSFALQKIIYCCILTRKWLIVSQWKKELFTVEKYKKELAKPYPKLDLYLCRTSDFSVGNSVRLSTLNKTESTTSTSPAIANNTPYMHEGKPEETSLSELDAYLNQNDTINGSENVSLNTPPLQHSPVFGMKILVW